MSKAGILAELPKLTPAERQEIRLKLACLDGEEWLEGAESLSALTHTHPSGNIPRARKV